MICLFKISSNNKIYINLDALSQETPANDPECAVLDKNSLGIQMLFDAYQSDDEDVNLDPSQSLFSQDSVVGR